MASCELMTEAPKHTRSGFATTRRLLAVLAGVGLLAAACASDADDSADRSRSDPAQPAATTGAPDTASDDESGEPDASANGMSEADAGGDESDTTGTGADRDSTSAEIEDGEGAAAQDTSAHNGSSQDSAAPAGAETPVSGVETAALRSFDECAALLDYVHTHAAAAAGPWGFETGFGGGFGPFGFADDAVADMAEEGPFPAAAAAGGDVPLLAGEDYSTSNLQESGIDEPDSVKTDGRRMVLTVRDTVQAVDVSGTTPRRIGSVSLDGTWPAQLLLHGDRVVAFVRRWDSPLPFPVIGRSDDDDGERLWHGDDWGPTTELVEIELTEGDPRIVRRLTLEGDLVGGRMIDGVIHVVTATHPRRIDWVIPQRDTPAELSQAAAANRRLVASTGVEHWLPQYQLADAAGNVTAGGQLGSCERTFAPAHYGGPGTLTVTSVDLGAGDGGLAGSVEATSILAGGRDIYASSEHLYVSTTRWDDLRRWQEFDTAASDGAEMPQTVTEVHQFEISSRGDAAGYVTTASVPGILLNQYSMSEYDGYLRIATTVSPPWFFGDDLSSESLLTVLDADDGALSQVGQIGGLGVGERIYAVRYLGDVAAVVTFRQVDPLYLIDLSDPAAPDVRGELKITGYSAYLHPVAEDLLLGVGQEADLDGVTQGSQVSLFDIGDLDSPQRIDQWTLAGAHSNVEFDALHFLYWPPSELMVMPVIQYLDGDAAAAPSASPLMGAVALSTSQRQLAELARLSHADEPTRRCNEHREIVIRPDGTEEAGSLERFCWYDQDWEAQITATAVVGDRLYLASAKGLQAVDLATFAPVGLLHWDR